MKRGEQMPHRSSAPLGWRMSKSHYSLLGSRCSCGRFFFPKRGICSCGKRTEDFLFSGSGVVVSFTVIRNAPAGFGLYAPYIVGIIKLDEGPKTTGQVVGSVKDIKIGSRVRPVFRGLGVGGVGSIIKYTTKFEVV